uniref:DUF985 domain-containing protein n=1 Tax=Oryza meridionalis TaxID=40149 RepID=A0A0E0DYB2_9ORYZ
MIPKNLDRRRSRRERERGEESMAATSSEKKTAAEVVAMLDLQRHPDGGFILETFRDPSISLPKSALPPRYKVDRAVSNAIYFLLPAGEIVQLHRIPCAETWHYYMGEPLTVFEVHDDGQFKMTVVGPDLRHGQKPQYTVPPNVWFGAFLTCDIESFTEDGKAAGSLGQKAEQRREESMAATSAEKKTAAEIVAMLDLQRHPDGGFYLETFRDPSISLPKSALPPRYKVDRSVSSAIYFLLPAGEIAKLHRIPCAETWHYYMGEPLTVFEVHDDGQIKMTVVGPDLRHGQRPQYTVPPNVWFGAFLTRDVESFTEDGSVFVKTPGRDSELHYSFVGVTCAPAFQFEDNEMATRETMKTLAPKAEAFINYLVPSD